MHKVSLIVATKDRPNDLRRMLESLRAQSATPDEIIVVDAGHQSVDSVLTEFPELNIHHLRHWPPSAAAQRNAGIRASNPAAMLVGFADDDTTFEPHAFANMLIYWSQAPSDLLGCAFNLRNYPPRANGLLKSSSLAEWLGLYSPKPGSVSPSGWQTVIGQFSQTQFVDWLPSTAVLFRRKVFDRNLFDEFFDGYSYLEDLDFGYTLSRIGKLAVVADAGFSHFPSSEGRISMHTFGRYEVRNRLHFVRKHHLSVPRCYLGLAIRLAMSIGIGLAHFDTNSLLRAEGNIEELLRQTFTPPVNIPLTSRE